MERQVSIGENDEELADQYAAAWEAWQATEAVWDESSGDGLAAPER